MQKFWEDKLLRNLGKIMSVIGQPTPNVRSHHNWVHGAEYGLSWCDPPGGIQVQISKRTSYLKVFKT